MSVPKKPDTLVVDEAKRREELLNAIRQRPTDDIKEMAKSCYASLARLKNEMMPIETDYGVMLHVLHERLLAEKRMVINDSEFYIALEETKAGNPIKNDHALYHELRALVIDGEPLSDEILADVAWEETPKPPPPVIKTNLTKLKQLAKQLGEPVQALIRAHVHYPEARTRFIFVPKEKNVRNSDPRAIGSSNELDEATS